MNDKRLINSKGKYEESKSFSEVLKINKSYLIEFAWLNVSRNRKLFKREGESTVSSLFHYVIAIVVEVLLV